MLQLWCIEGLVLWIVEPCGHFLSLTLPRSVKIVKEIFKCWVTPCPNYTRRDNIPATSTLCVHTRRDATESIKYHSQSEACVGVASPEALCTPNEVDTFIIQFINIKAF